MADSNRYHLSSLPLPVYNVYLNNNRLVPLSLKYGVHIFVKFFPLPSILFQFDRFPASLNWKVTNGGGDNLTQISNMLRIN